MQRIVLLIFVMIWNLCGCGEKPDPLDADGLVTFDITYSQHIKPLMETYCTRCHASSLQGIARNGATPGINFDSFETTQNAAQAANRRIQRNTMPPTTPKLSGDEKALFATWLEQGLTQ